MNEQHSFVRRERFAEHQAARQVFGLDRNLGAYFESVRETNCPEHAKRPLPDAGDSEVAECHSQIPTVPKLQFGTRRSNVQFMQPSVEGIANQSTPR